MSAGVTAWHRAIAACADRVSLVTFQATRPLFFTVRGVRGAARDRTATLVVALGDGSGGTKGTIVVRDHGQLIGAQRALTSDPSAVVDAAAVLITMVWSTLDVLRLRRDVYRYVRATRDGVIVSTPHGAAHAASAWMTLRYIEAGLDAAALVAELEAEAAGR